MNASAPSSPTRLRKQPQAQPIPGYRLIEPLGRGGFGEVWKCEAPGGLFKAIKFVDGNAKAGPAAGSGMRQELEALQRIKAIRHPFLLSIDRIEVIDGELVLVMELADASLLDLLRQCQAQGKPGLPRDDLLGYLWETAEVLDLMNLQHDLQHLDIKPANLFLISNHVKVADFGLVNSLQDVKAGASPSRPPLSISPLYAPPERFEAAASFASDQYSLAITYHELLTGKYPFAGKSYLQLMMQHTKKEPDLSLLPHTDRAAVARALSKDPAGRFPSCTDFLRALVAGEGGRLSTRSNAAVAGPLRPSEAGAGGVGGPETPPASPAASTTPGVVQQTVPGEDPFLSQCHVLALFGKDALGEHWLAQAPDGPKRLVKRLYGFASLDSDGEWDALLRVIGFRHDGLSPLEVLQGNPTRLCLASGPFEQTLQECCQECQSQGLPGIPRRELLGYLREAADILDALYEEHELPHLGLTPHNLVLTESAFLIADYGLVPLLYLPTDEGIGPFMARYAAPELFERAVGPGCDQYSLALIYVEMRTGRHAYHGLSDRQLSHARRRGDADLSGLPVAEQEVLSRALAPRAKERFPTCTAMVHALEAVLVAPADAKPTTSSVASGRERRMQDRLPIDRPVTLFAALPHDAVGEALECQGKDISLNGIGVRSPQRPATAQVYVQLHVPDRPAPLMVRAHVMRIHAAADGSCDVGLLFLTPLDQALLTGFFHDHGPELSHVG